MLEINDRKFFTELVADAVSQASQTCQSEDSAKRWVKAIGKAAAFIDKDTTFLHYNHEEKTLLIFSDSNEIYTANGTCQCKAYQQSPSQPCYHRAMARLVRQYFELQYNPFLSAETPEREKTDLKCRPKCGHTDFEHHVFDSGYHAGLDGKTENPFRSGNFREVWATGNSVGAMDALKFAAE